MSMQTLGVCFVIGAALVSARPRANYEVRVCLREHVRAPELLVATRSAAVILGTAGVRIRWCHGLLNQDGGPAPVLVEIFADAPAETPSGVQARSFPYTEDGARIEVYRNRVLLLAPEGYAASGSVLGHVLAHEITHVLEGISRHSDEGLMAAHWSTEVLRQMVRAPLPLLPHDVELIQAALLWRNSTIARR
jgi:hypothetical protein